MTATTNEISTPVAAQPARQSVSCGLTARLWDLAEVRWAAIATVLFALGGAAQLVGAPRPLWWAGFRQRVADRHLRHLRRP